MAEAGKRAAGSQPGAYQIRSFTRKTRSQHAEANPKYEARISKQIHITKFKAQNKDLPGQQSWIVDIGLIWTCFGLRYADFEF
jgi:hypothetical protein